MERPLQPQREGVRLPPSGWKIVERINVTIGAIVAVVGFIIWAIWLFKPLWE